MRPARNRSTYGSVGVAGNANAVIGDHIGDNLHINHATFMHSSASLSDTGPTSGITVRRRNRVFRTHTLEIITTYNEDGTSHETQKRWETCDYLGGGISSEVYRQECQETKNVRKSRAVKVLRTQQLKETKIDYKTELDTWIHLSQVTFVVHTDDVMY